METIVVFVHIIVAVFIIGLVMIQHGKGAEAGASLNSTSQSLFGSQGSTSFLVKLTTYLVISFFVTSLLLAQMGVKSRDAGSLIDVIDVQAVDSDVPASVGSVKALDVEQDSSIQLPPSTSESATGK